MNSLRVSASDRTGKLKTRNGKFGRRNNTSSNKYFTRKCLVVWGFFLVVRTPISRKIINPKRMVTATLMLHDCTDFLYFIRQSLVFLSRTYSCSIISTLKVSFVATSLHSSQLGKLTVLFSCTE